jgi:hypothetical protein
MLMNEDHRGMLLYLKAGEFSPPHTSRILYIEQKEKPMNGRKFVSMGLTVLTATFLWVASVWAAEEDTGYPWFADIMENNQTILQPGTMTNCYDDFTVENMGKEVAEVRIVRGDGDNRDIDQIPAGDKRGYTLQYPTGASEGNWVDEVRIVNSTAGNSKLKVHCK